MASRKGVSPDQLKQLWDELNLTVAGLATATGIPKGYISEFRSGARNLPPQQQAQLRAYLDEQCEGRGLDFPDDDGTTQDPAIERLSAFLQRAKVSGILPSGDVPAAQVRQLQDLIDANRVRVSELLKGPFQAGGGLLGGEFSADTEGAIRELFGLLAVNYIAVLILQGRSVVNQVPGESAPQTIGDWLSRYLADESRLGALLPQGDNDTSDEPLEVSR